MARYVIMASPRRDEFYWALHGDTVNSLIKENIGIFNLNIQGLPYDMARNRLVEDALVRREALLLATPPIVVDGLFWVDDDVALPPDALMKLLSHNQPIVSGLYFSRRQPHTPQMYRLAEGYEDKYWPILDWPKGEVIEADACGFGCMWTSFEVLEAVQRKPGFKEWFKFDWPRGEDFYFCRAAKECGFEVLVDTSIRCGHMTNILVDETIFDVLRPRMVRLGDDGKPIDSVPSMPEEQILRIEAQ